MERVHWKASLAVVAAVLCMAGISVWAANISGLIRDVDACFTAWVNGTNEVDNAYNPWYGGSPNPQKWKEGLEAENEKFDNCVDQAITRNKLSFGLAYLHGQNWPDTVIYHFENDFDPGDPVYLTVYNGTDQVGRFDQASIWLNGSEVAGRADFSGAAYFEKTVTLVPGVNELRIDVDPGADGNMMVFLTHERLSPPN